MKYIGFSVLVMLGVLLLPSVAEAKRHHHRHHAHHRAHATKVLQVSSFSFVSQRRGQVPQFYGAPSVNVTPHATPRVGPRPGRWCGWFMQVETGVTSGVTGRNLNMAREWAHVGSNAGGPRVGAIVVWRHHVGKITGQVGNGQWIVKSGNDGHRVRERIRSVSGAIAFRYL